jgi:uncharacterized protein DUF1707
MTDFSENSAAGLRLSNAERDRAVAALQSHAGDGRLTDAELQTRVQSARGAVTRGDLTPLFADLPGFVDFDGSGAPAAPQPFSAPQQFAAPQQAEPVERAAGGRGTRAYGRTGYIVVSIVPFIALILFFLTSWAWGYTYSWLWFLLVPIAGVIVYGGGYGDDRNRDRNRDRR